MSNEPERNALHEFICASVADCIASIYPRANPRQFREIINRTKAPACAPETAAEYIVRTVSEALTRDTACIAEAGYCTRNGCDCPCCEAAHAKLRAISYERACAIPAAVHCASTDRRDDNEDASIGWDRCPPSEETVFPALDRLEEDTGPRPAGTD